MKKIIPKKPSHNCIQMINIENVVQIDYDKYKHVWIYKTHNNEYDIEIGGFRYCPFCGKELRTKDKGGKCIDIVRYMARRGEY